MGAPHVTIKDAAGRIIEMQASPDFQYDTAFDSFLILKNNGCDNHTLTLVLKLHLEQVVPMTWNLPFLGPVPLPYPDADKTLFVIKPWSAADFASFHKLFLRQCTLWNDKFWLTPPAGFTGLDYKLGGRTVHPNIYCHLFVTVTGTPAGAHRTIQVVNLDKAAAARQLGKRVAALDSADFRSDAGQYDSLDVKNNQLTYADDKGKTHKVTHSTIAHEVGHAIGLPHIGETYKTPKCEVAMLADSLLPSWVTSADSFPGLYKGGSNSHVCYGHSGPAHLGKNIMGYGAQFDATNAQPWLDRIALHTGTNAGDWKVSVKKRIVPKVL